MASRRTKSRSRKSASKRGPRGSRGARGRPAGATAIWVGALALAGVAAVGTAVYFTEKKANAGVLPPGPPGPPVPYGPGDIYGALTPAQQLAVQQKLYAYIATSPNCPGVLTNAAQQGIMSYADIADSGNRAEATDCFQQSYNVGHGTVLGSGGNTGVLDSPTYMALMNS